MPLLDEIEGSWTALCGRAASDEPFYRPEWTRAYARAFMRSPRFVFVTLHAGQRLCALLPLVRETAFVGGLPARVLRSAGNTHTCRFDLLCEPDVAPDDVHAMWRALSTMSGWDCLLLENVPDGSPLMELVDHAAREGAPTARVPGLTPPFLDLSASGGHYDRMLGRLDSKFRSNLRRRMRKLEAEGPVAVAAATERGPWLERFVALERAGWKGSEASAIGSSEATRAFYDEIARAAEREGYLSLYALQCGDRVAAMFLGLYYRDRYYLLKTAYDETLASCSPGQLLTSEALRDLVGRGCRELDFLGGAMEWKKDWAPRERALQDVYVFRGSIGRAVHALRFRLRPAAARLYRSVRRSSR